MSKSSDDLADKLYNADPNRCHEDARYFDSQELKDLAREAAKQALLEAADFVAENGFQVPWGGQTHWTAEHWLLARADQIGD